MSSTSISSSSTSGIDFINFSFVALSNLRVLSYSPPFITLRQKQQNLQQQQQQISHTTPGRAHPPLPLGTSSPHSPHSPSTSPIKVHNHLHNTTSTTAQASNGTSAIPSQLSSLKALRSPSPETTTATPPSDSTPKALHGKGHHKIEQKVEKGSSHHPKGNHTINESAEQNKKHAPKSMGNKVAQKEEEQKVDQLQIQSGELDLAAVTTENPLVENTTGGGSDEFITPSPSSSYTSVEGPGDEGTGESGGGSDAEDGTSRGEPDDFNPTPPPLGGTKKGTGRKGKGGKHRGGGSFGGLKRGGGAYGEHHGLPLTPMQNSIATMLRCQDLDTREMVSSATTCRNTRSDKVCAYLFMEVDLRTGRRDVKCNLQGLEDIAESCRRTCGICCEDINYSCEDDNNGIIDCGRQLDKCHINKWFGVLSRFCAGSCGLCARTACRDYDNTCRVRKSLCLKEETVDYMRENCARTCGFCVVGDLYPGGADSALSELMASSAGGGGNGIEGSGGAVAVAHSAMAMRPVQQPGAIAAIYSSRGASGGPSRHPLIPADCQDRAANCTQNEELCTSPLYSEYMIKFCTKTCLKCKPTGSGNNNNEDGRLQHSHRPVPTLEMPLEDAVTGFENKRQRKIGAVNQHPTHAMRSAAAATGTTMGGKRVGKKCEDKHAKCRQWVGNGLCTNENYTIGERKRLCAKSCKLC